MVRKGGEKSESAEQKGLVEKRGNRTLLGLAQGSSRLLQEEENFRQRREGGGGHFSFTFSDKWREGGLIPPLSPLLRP